MEINKDKTLAKFTKSTRKDEEKRHWIDSIASLTGKSKRNITLMINTAYKGLPTEKVTEIIKDFYLKAKESENPAIKWWTLWKAHRPRNK